MKISYATTKKWLETDAEKCSAEELCTLLQLIEDALKIVEKRDEKLTGALAEMERLAKSVGFDSVQDLMKLVTKSSRSSVSTTDVRAPRAGLRKPFMNPLDPHSGIFALTHLHDLPDWAQACVDKGWSKDELHYKRIAAGWSARGIEPLFDPIARHAELVKKEIENSVVFQRPKKAD